jgi:predicted transcriptional regulator
MPDLRTNQEITNQALRYWYMFIIVALIAGVAITGYLYTSKEKELESLQIQLELQETIKQTEARLLAIQEREKEYLKIQVAQEKLNKTLVELERQQRELAKRKKGIIENEIKKMDNTALSNTLGSMGLPNTIVSGGGN